jgi:hypothetical protein
MSNHGYVRSKRRITKEHVDKALADINEKFLFGKLVVEYSHHPDNPQGWGLHVWEVHHKDQPHEGRIMWLKNDRTKTFEIRHGGGGDFIWWIDHLIRNSVSEITDGVITDDGHGDKSTYADCPSIPFREFKLRQWIRPGRKLSEIRWLVTQLWKLDSYAPPPEHTKPKVPKT